MAVTLKKVKVRWLKTKQAAALIGVSQSRMADWCQSYGDFWTIPCSPDGFIVKRLSSRGWFYVEMETLLRFVRKVLKRDVDAGHEQFYRSRITPTDTVLPLNSKLEAFFGDAVVGDATSTPPPPAEEKKQQPLWNEDKIEEGEVEYEEDDESEEYEEEVEYEEDDEEDDESEEYEEEEEEEEDEEEDVVHPPYIHVDENASDVDPNVACLVNVSPLDLQMPRDIVLTTWALRSLEEFVRHGAVFFHYDPEELYDLDTVVVLQRVAERNDFIVVTNNEKRSFHMFNRSMLPTAVNRNKVAHVPF